MSGETSAAAKVQPRRFRSPVAHGPCGPDWLAIDLLARLAIRAMSLVLARRFV
jgi:hypothetical protein